MPKLTEVFKIKEGDVIPINKNKTAVNRNETSDDGIGTQTVKKLSQRAQGLLNVEALKGLIAVAKQVDELPIDAEETKAAVKLFVSLVKALGTAAEML